MKKLVFAVAVCAVLVSCKKIAAGGNQGVIVLEDGVERYDSNESRKAEQHQAAAVMDTVATTSKVSDSTASTTSEPAH